MGTLFTITLYAPDQAQAEGAAETACRRVAALEDVMSDYRTDSELMRLCDQPWGKPVQVSADLFDVMEQAQKYARLSRGAFDMTVGPYVRLWRFARKRKVLPTSLELATAAKSVGYQNVRMDEKSRTVTLLAPDMRLDLGGIGKGYAADQALKVLNSRGIHRALVAASGDIAIGDPPPGQAGWKVDIARIGATDGKAESSILLHNCGISTSGDTEQFIEIGGVRYSHVIDPSTGLGLTNRIQATVIAPTATMTDGLDNTLCTLGPKRALALVEHLPRTAALILVKEGDKTQTFASKRFKRLLQE
jgi:thiamine biosynthesis lipoprotein